MKLEFDGEVISEAASAIEVLEALERLADSGGAFVLLARDTMTYMQTADNADGRYVIEYQVGSVTEHYACYDANLDTVKAAFGAYLDGDPSWQKMVTWEKQDF